MAIDEAKLNAFMGNFVRDLGAVMHAATIVVGDQLGLYKALSHGPLTAEALAEKTGTDARYVREWLSAQAASGYVEFDPATQQFSMTAEQVFALATDDSPAFIPGAFEIAVAQFKAIPKIADAFKTGRGLGWHEHDAALFHGTERFFRPGYTANLVTSWIPSLKGVEEKLKAGGRAADVGCGHGASTIIMAQAYPKSKFFGFDYHEPSIRYARAAAAQAGVADRTEFAVASAKEYPGRDFDFVAVFDCLHDMGDPRRGVGTCSAEPASRRDVDDRRAVCARSSGRQPEPRGPGLLFGLGVHLHAGVARAGGRHVPRRPGRRSAHTRGRQQRRVQAFQARQRNAFQPRLRGKALNPANAPRRKP